MIALSQVIYIVSVNKTITYSGKTSCGKMERKGGVPMNYAEEAPVAPTGGKKKPAGKNSAAKPAPDAPPTGENAGATE